MRRLAVGLLTLLVAGAAMGADVQVYGIVRGPAGEPAPDVEVATYWIDSGQGFEARSSFVTSEAGAFVGDVRWSRRSRSLMAFDATRDLGAMALLDEGSLGGAIELRLQPTVMLRGEVASPGLPHPIEQTYVSVTAAPAMIAVASLTTTTRFEVPLPPGTYELRIAARDCQRVRERVVLVEGDMGLDLGTIELEPTIIARHYGRAPPAWHVTAARGADPLATLADWKGKWVLLEFWGHW